MPTLQKVQTRSGQTSNVETTGAENVSEIAPNHHPSDMQ
jgi:hypothetical protein